MVHGCQLRHVLVCLLQMGLVSQDCLLFQGSIQDNIRYGTQQASHEQVVEAAKAAYAHDFIMALPQVGCWRRDTKHTAPDTAPRR
jgi:ABC-type multidrug transport system fused ATPase/permease subunit